MEQKEVKFGIMCFGTTFPLWQANAILNLVKLDGVSCKLLIIKETENEILSKRILKKLKFQNILWTVYYYFIKKKFTTIKETDLCEELAEANKIYCKPILKGKYSEYFEEADIESIKSHDLDFILRLGFGIIRGEILNVAKFGVWSFHHDDEQKYRGGPPCFWEIYHNDNITGGILQKLTDKLDGGIILKKGYLKTLLSYTKNRDQLYHESSKWPTQLCIDIKNGHTDCFNKEPSKTNAAIYRAPTNLQFLIYITRTAVLKIIKIYKSLFYLSYWNIGIVKENITSFLNDKNPIVDWLPLNTKSKFNADPFAIVDENDKSKIHIFYECYPYKDSKGVINYVSYYNGEYADNCTVIDRDFHLSYPYTLKHEDKYYIIPECFKENNISIYEAVDFPKKWEKKKVLIDNFAGVDSVILNYDRIWWLFTSNKNDGVHYNLNVFYADELFGVWNAHPKNPVKTDVRSARCAGNLFMDNGDLFRPGMNYAEKEEGSIIINKIVKLSKTEFEEIPIKTIEPYKDSFFSDKIHTLSDCGMFTLVDGCREVFVFSNINFLRFKISQVLKKTVKLVS